MKKALTAVLVIISLIIMSFSFTVCSKEEPEIYMVGRVQEIKVDEDLIVISLKDDGTYKGKETTEPVSKEALVTFDKESVALDKLGNKITFASVEIGTRVKVVFRSPITKGTPDKGIVKSIQLQN